MVIDHPKAMDVFFSRVVLDAKHPVHCCEILHQFVDGFFHYHYNLIVQYFSQCFIGVPIVTGLVQDFSTIHSMIKHRNTASKCHPSGGRLGF